MGLSCNQRGLARFPDTLCTVSGGQGDCVQVADGDCVQVADGIPHLTPVRDSKQHPTAPVICFGHDAWQAFLTHLS
ncbi:DUF397 domain-containing protein [Streptomyces sp. NPDC050147]|uniref:DUF397 domain-containing protein n=1 Tax=Streptomyces sp. NPDC050147 TaxID=3155513 RepID=UPI0034385A67